MARVGRGRSRGGRILDIADFPPRGMGHGKITVQGITNSEIEIQKSQTYPISTQQPETKYISHSLEKKLKDFDRTKNGSFIHITLEYFSSSDDVTYYINKVMESLLMSSFMIEKFTRSFRLITLLKTHGDQIKLAMFSKLQTAFKDMLVIMKENNNQSVDERIKARNLCELLGELYFTFRLQLDSLERYNVLATPVTACMSYLTRGQDSTELSLLVKLIFLNYPTLYEINEQDMTKLSLEVRNAIIVTEGTERIWLVLALDYILHYPNELPLPVKQYYAVKLGQPWDNIVPTSPMQVLDEIPPDIVGTQIDKFNVLVEEYNKHRFIDL